MLRPSRPMMRPFMSSAGSWTTDTVVSAAWPAASRCMTTERMLRTRRSASRLVSSSIWRTSLAESCRIWSSSSFSSSCLACEAERPDARSSSRRWRSCSAVELRLARGDLRLVVLELLPAAVERLLAPVQPLLLAPDLGAPGRFLRGGLAGRAARPAPVLAAWAEPAMPGTRFTSSSAAADQADREHHSRDHDFHFRVLSPAYGCRPRARVRYPSLVAGGRPSRARHERMSTRRKAAAAAPIRWRLGAELGRWSRARPPGCRVVPGGIVDGCRHG